MGYGGMNYVDPIQQGIKTYGMLKDIDRQDNADQRANEMHAEQLTEKKFNQAEREKVTGREEVERSILGIQTRIDAHKASNAVDAFRFSPEDVAVLAKAKMLNPTVAKTAPDDLAVQAGSLRDVVNASSMLLRSPELKGKRLSISDPQILEGFNAAFLSELQGGEHDTKQVAGDADKKAAGIFVDNSVDIPKISVELQVKGRDGNGSYAAPLTLGRGSGDDAVVHEIPAPVLAQYAQANADFAEQVYAAYQQDPELFNRALEANGGTVGKELGRTRRESQSKLDLKKSELKLGDERSAMVNAVTNKEMAVLRPKLEGILADDTLSAKEKRGQISAMVAAASPETQTRLTGARTMATALVPEKDEVKAPTTRTFKANGFEVTEEFDSASRQWKEVGRNRIREAGSGGGDQKRSENMSKDEINKTIAEINGARARLADAKKAGGEEGIENAEQDLLFAKTAYKNRTAEHRTEFGKAYDPIGEVVNSPERRNIQPLKDGFAESGGMVFGRRDYDGFIKSAINAGWTEDEITRSAKGTEGESAVKEYFRSGQSSMAGQAQGAGAMAAAGGGGQKLPAQKPGQAAGSATVKGGRITVNFK